MRLLITCIIANSEPSALCTHTHTHTHTQVWRYDGTVECYIEGYLPLAIWAGIVLAIYTLFFLLVPIFTQLLLAMVSDRLKGQ